MIFSNQTLYSDLSRNSKPFYKPQAKDFAFCLSLNSGKKKWLKRRTSVKSKIPCNQSPVLLSKWLTKSGQVAHRPGSADLEHRPPKRQVTGPQGLCSESSKCPRASEYLHFSSFPCLLLQLLSGTFREWEAGGRKCPQIKLTFLLFQFLRKPLSAYLFLPAIIFNQFYWKKQRIRSALTSWAVQSSPLYNRKILVGEVKCWEITV